ncbi:UNVERIFIED_CONTAM: Retrovirus-related Pol polyprotein from transposon TNT 1-94 [Sesamum indicum]
MYNPVAKKIIVSHDVVFYENRVWNWDADYEKEQLMDLEWGDSTVITTNQEGEAVEDVDGAVNEAPIAEENLTAREGRIRHPPVWMTDYTSGEELSKDDEVNMTSIALVVSSDPTSFEDAVKSSKWRLVMDEEIKSIEKNQTWQLVELSIGTKKIGVKWVYKTKLNELGEVDTYKARLIVKGYSQQHGIDYTEVYAPVAKMDTVRMIIAFAAKRGWSLYQLDVKSAFLHGELKEDVFVEQPRGYEKKGSEHMVYKLQKTLHRLKQAPRASFSWIKSYFIKEGFETTPSEPTLFLKRKGGKILIVSIYVDDLLFTSDDEVMLCEFKNSMNKQFDMIDLGKMRFFLGIEVFQRADGVFICQRKYAVEVLSRFGMEESNSVRNPIVLLVKRLMRIKKESKQMQLSSSKWWEA